MPSSWWIRRAGISPRNLWDQAGWHQSKKLVVPANITLMPLPAKAPELNPVENIWQTVCSFLKRRWLVPRYAANEGCAG